MHDTHEAARAVQ